jgi:hypothetical protein
MGAKVAQAPVFAITRAARFPAAHSRAARAAIVFSGRLWYKGNSARKHSNAQLKQEGGTL